MDDLSSERLILYLEEYVRTTCENHPGTHEQVARELDLSDAALEDLLDRAKELREDGADGFEQLTDQQRQQVYERAVEFMTESISENVMDLRATSNFVEQAIMADPNDLEDMLNLISSDQEVLLEMLGFDPETGDEVEV